MASILNLDDEPNVLSAVGIALRFEGYDYRGTSDERRALFYLRNRPVDLFVQDFMRPGEGGFAFLRQMKSEERLRRIPVLGLSACPALLCASRMQEYDLDFDRDLDGYVRKPPTINRMLRSIERILTTRGIPIPTRRSADIHQGLD